jgi:hypothetical protein
LSRPEQRAPGNLCAWGYFISILIVCFVPIQLVDNFDFGALRADWFWHRARSDAIHPPAFVNNPKFRSLGGS